MTDDSDMAEELLTTDDATEEEDTAEELEELSAKPSGANMRAVVAAANRERDFFIRKKGKGPVHSITKSPVLDLRGPYQLFL